MINFFERIPIDSMQAIQTIISTVTWKVLLILTSVKINFRHNYPQTIFRRFCASNSLKLSYDKVQNHSNSKLDDHYFPVNDLTISGHFLNSYFSNYLYSDLKRRFTRLLWKIFWTFVTIARLKTLNLKFDYEIKKKTWL